MITDNQNQEEYKLKNDLSIQKKRKKRTLEELEINQFHSFDNISNQSSKIQ